MQIASFSLESNTCVIRYIILSFDDRGIRCSVSQMSKILLRNVLRDFLEVNTYSIGVVIP